ncbi:MAG TPA: cation:dicarboxylase symporter family transporter, partial [Labilithrix sp.]|nr:cation:dicarboxylase symporter family transporter [Labilithrix sp.]
MSMSPGKPWYRSGTFWIFVALVLGVVMGGSLPEHEHPHWYAFFGFLSHAFIGLIKGLIVPLLLSTIIVGIAQTGDLKSVGRMGGKALLYFEVVTTFALVIGLAVVNLTKPGAGLPLNAAGHAAKEVAQPSGWDIALHALPTNIIKHAADNQILPIVVFATIFAMALTSLGPKGKPLLSFFDIVAQTMFKYTDYVMLLTPLGVFGSMASNVSHMAAPHTAGGVGAAAATSEGWAAVFHLL